MKLIDILRENSEYNSCLICGNKFDDNDMYGIEYGECKDCRESLDEGWGAYGQKREQERMEKEWEYFRAKLSPEDQEKYDKLRGLRGEAAYHRVIGGEGRLYRVGMYR